MPSPEEGEERRYVDGTYLSEHRSWHEEDAPWKAAQVRSFMQRHDLRPKSICDIGCGTAGVLFHLAPNFPDDTRLVGFDPSLDALRLGASRTERIELFATDARDCAERFDVVLMLDVFEHVEDYIGFLRSTRATGRHFIFHIPLDMSVQAVLRTSPLLRARNKTGHLHYFSRETALATLNDAGFRVIDHVYTRGGIDLPQTQMGTRLAAVPRSLAFLLMPDVAVRILGGFSLLVLAEPELSATPMDRS